MNIIGVFAMFALMLGMFAFMYLALNAAYSPIYAWAQTAITTTKETATMSLLNILWVWLPITLLFAMVVYLITRSWRDEPQWP